jgi:tRNA pseudouridine13 synthase
MMKSPYPLEQELGICWYAGDTPGIGGVLRSFPEDFVVDEIASPDLGDGPYLICRLSKRNWELQHAVKEIANQLAISHRRIAWAGTKDKRAVTTQYLSIFGIGPEEISRVRLKEISLEVIGRSAHALSLGELEGNRFAITIRECDPEDLPRRIGTVAGLAAEGLPNYFGLQRFGVIRPVTHVVGRHMLKGDYEGAVMTYVGLACEGEPEETYQARNHFRETGDVRQALKELPVQLRYERALLSHLSGNPGDFSGALQELPPKLLSMFISAYQSYLFNLTLSRRLAEGHALTEPSPGDRLVFGNGREDIVTGKNLRTAAVHIRRGRCRIAIYIPGSVAGTLHGPMDRSLAALMEEDGISGRQYEEAGKIVGIPFSGTHRPVALNTEIDWELHDTTAGLAFSLGPGQYATTVCREFMKADPRRMI